MCPLLKQKEIITSLEILSKAIIPTIDQGRDPPLESNQRQGYRKRLKKREEKEKKKNGDTIDWNT